MNGTAAHEATAWGTAPIPALSITQGASVSGMKNSAGPFLAGLDAAPVAASSLTSSAPSDQSRSSSWSSAGHPWAQPSHPACRPPAFCYHGRKTRGLVGRSTARSRFRDLSQSSIVARPSR